MSDKIDKCIDYLAKSTMPEWIASAKAELERLRTDSRELAAMKAGGVWLPRVDAVIRGKKYLVIRPGGDTFSIFTSDTYTGNYDKTFGIAYGPLPNHPTISEGRDDG